MAEILAWLRIARFHALIITFLTTLGCTLLSGMSSIGDACIVAFLAPLVLAGACMENDCLDIESDRLLEHREWRPLPSGVLHRGDVMNATYMLYGFSILLTACTYPRAVITVASVIFAVVLYNRTGKHRGQLFGHLLAAYACTGVVTVPMAVTNNWSLWALAVAVFVMEIAREIMVSVPDVDGDRKAGFQTLPVTWGVKKSLYVAYPFVGLYIVFFNLAPIYNTQLGILYIGTAWLWAFGLLTAPLLFIVGSGIENTRYSFIYFQGFTKLPMLMMAVVLVLEVMF